jgi:hypothetical protein
MSADGKIPAAQIRTGVRIVVELVHQTAGPRAGQDQPVNTARKGSGYAAAVQRVYSELVRPAGGRRATRRYFAVTDLGTVNLAPAETVWVVDALPARSYTAVTSRTAAYHAERGDAAAAARLTAETDLARRGAGVAAARVAQRPAAPQYRPTAELASVLELATDPAALF